MGVSAQLLCSRLKSGFGSIVVVTISARTRKGRSYYTKHNENEPLRWGYFASTVEVRCIRETGTTLSLEDCSHNVHSGGSQNTEINANGTGTFGFPVTLKKHE